MAPSRVNTNNMHKHAPLSLLCPKCPNLIGSMIESSTRMHLEKRELNFSCRCCLFLFFNHTFCLSNNTQNNVANEQQPSILINSKQELDELNALQALKNTNSLFFCPSTKCSHDNSLSKDAAMASRPISSVSETTMATDSNAAYSTYNK